MKIKVLSVNLLWEHRQWDAATGTTSELIIEKTDEKGYFVDTKGWHKEAIQNLKEDHPWIERFLGIKFIIL